LRPPTGGRLVPPVGLDIALGSSASTSRRCSLVAYVRHQQQQKAANATINRELAALKRMFRLGERAGKVLRPPFIDVLKEHNARTGFFERADLDAVLARLPDDLKAVFTVAYLTGWRVKSELLTRASGRTSTFT
jgi:integrase